MSVKIITKQNVKDYLDELIFELQGQLDDNKAIGDWFACEEIEQDICVVGQVKRLIGRVM